MNQPHPLPSRTAQLEAHIRLLERELAHSEILRARWMIAALCGWALFLGILFAFFAA